MCVGGQVEQDPGDPASPNPPTPQPDSVRFRLEERLLPPPAVMAQAPMRTRRRRIRPETKRKELLDIMKKV